MLLLFISQRTLAYFCALNPPPPPPPLPIQDFYNSSLKGKNGWLKQQQQQQQQILLEIRYITNYITFLPANSL